MGTEISKYELDYMQKEYDLLLARIALEEAQNTKSQLRLTRNAEGGMSYQHSKEAEGVIIYLQNSNESNEEEHH